MFEISARDKIIKAKLALRYSNPFFFGLSMYLNLVEEESIDTMGVDNKDNLHYNPTFVLSLSIRQLQMILIHEIMHIILLHTSKVRPKKSLDNIAKDIKVNKILVDEGYETELREAKGYCPENNEITVELIDENNRLHQINITDIDIKTNGDIYSELEHINLKEEQKQKKSPTSSHDKHDQQSATDEAQQNRNINRRLEQAMMMAKGNVSDSLKRIISELVEPEVDYTEYMRDKINGYMITDFQWSKPSKLFYTHGIYLPGYKRESFKMLWHIDTSGSVSQRQFTKVLSELKGLLDNKDVEVELLIGDSDLKNHTTVTKQNVDETISSDLFKGHGGTSHQFVFEWIEKTGYQCNLIISFTDGYSDIPECFKQHNPTYPMIFIWDNSINKQCYDYGDVVIMKGIK